MWYLNYCAPFIYDQGGSAQTIRYFFIATLAIEYIIYLFYIFKYKCTGCTYPPTQNRSSSKLILTKATRTRSIYT